MKKALSRSMPGRVRNWIWCLTDAEFRKTYRENQKRISTLRGAQNQVGKMLLSQYGAAVIAGPFQGMSYFERLGGTVPTHKILGTYEKELWSIVEEITERDYTRVIDIGAAEGFYVVGLARRMPDVRVIAFEANPSLHARIVELANLNGVRDHIEIRGLCDAASLKSVLGTGANTLVICDIEGAEEHVLNPDDVPALRQTDILVEVHEHLAAGVTELLRSRFAPTHQIVEILSVPRVVDDCPSSVELPGELAIDAMNECRSPESKWFWMKNLSTQI